AVEGIAVVAVLAEVDDAVAADRDLTPDHRVEEVRLDLAAREPGTGDAEYVGIAAAGDRLIGGGVPEEPRRWRDRAREEGEERADVPLRHCAVEETGRVPDVLRVVDRPGAVRGVDVRPVRMGDGVALSRREPLHPDPDA